MRRFTTIAKFTYTTIVATLLCSCQSTNRLSLLPTWVPPAQASIVTPAASEPVVQQQPSTTPSSPPPPPPPPPPVDTTPPNNLISIPLPTGLQDKSQQNVKQTQPKIVRPAKPKPSPDMPSTQ